jgi:hypothetical protein
LGVEALREVGFDPSMAEPKRRGSDCFYGRLDGHRGWERPRCRLLSHLRSRKAAYPSSRGYHKLYSHSSKRCLAFPCHPEKLAEQARFNTTAHCSPTCSPQPSLSRALPSNSIATAMRSPIPPWTSCPASPVPYAINGHVHPPNITISPEHWSRPLDGDPVRWGLRAVAVPL